MPKNILKKDINSWPREAGRYTVGDKKNCVAVCTLSDLDIVVPMEKVAIAGKCVTENIGIEKIIKNIITNPNIRFLVLCGTEPKGHDVGQAFLSLVQNGLTDGRRIAGATGAMPFLRNVSDSEIEHFKQQITLIDLIGSRGVAAIEAAIDECNAKDPGAFDSFVKLDKQEEIIAADTGFKPDEKGFFVITIDRDRQKIIAEHYMGYGSDAKLHCKVVGKSAEEVSKTIAKLGLVSLLEHAAYLGRELQKAELALKLKKDYEQDKELLL